MSWNYRIVRRTYRMPDNGELYCEYAIHEAYYDGNGKVGSITADPVMVVGDCLNNLMVSWYMMSEAMRKPILDYDNIPEPGYNPKQDSIRMAIEDSIDPDAMENGIPIDEAMKRIRDQLGLDPSSQEEIHKREMDRKQEQETIYGTAFQNLRTASEVVQNIENLPEYIEIYRPD